MTITPFESDEYDPIVKNTPVFTEMKDHGAIGVFENFVKPEFCDSLLDCLSSGTPKSISRTYHRHMKYVRWVIIHLH